MPLSIRFPPGVATRPTASLFPGPRNPRTHGADQVEQIAASMRAFGWTNPVLVDPAGEIIAGEARWRAARLLELDETPIVELPGLTPAEREAYRLADNRIALNAGWDEDLLAAVLKDLEAVHFDLPALGFSDQELAQLLEPEARPGLTDADQAVPPPAAPVTRLGDIWQLGDHRLICNDSTKPETFAALFGDPRSTARLAIAGADTADLVLTDPPYGMDYEGGRARRAADLVVTDPPYGMSFGAGKEAGSTPKGALVKAHGMILGDDAHGADLVALVGSALSRAREWSKPAAATYVCLTWRTYSEFHAALQACGLKVASCIVWDKGSIGLGHQHYRPQHEFVFYCQGEAWYGGKAEGDVWTLSRGHTGEYVHPTQKPVALLERAIVNSSRAGDLVLDVFGGSGSTLIACERLGRIARLVELDPKYCDAIVRRWEKFTGREAVRLE